MITVALTEEEVVEIANHTAFTAYHALEDDDDTGRRTARIAVAILGKLEEAFPGLLEADELECEHEMRLLRKRVKAKGL